MNNLQKKLRILMIPIMAVNFALTAVAAVAERAGGRSPENPNTEAVK